MRLTASLIDREDSTHRQALAVYPRRTVEWALATAAEPWASRVARQAEEDFRAAGQRAAEQRVDSSMPDAKLRELADRRAALMADRIDSLSVAMGDRAFLGWLNAQVHELDARRDVFVFEGDAPEADQLRAFIARAKCPAWWRRQLRARVVRLREDEGRYAGEISARRQLYVTDDSVRRRAAQRKRNADMLESTELESEDGELLRLAVAAGASVSNRSIRRGELMTRIRGCEEWAEEKGMVGLFTTNTAPSRFHALRHEKQGGGRNHRYFGDETWEDRRRKWVDENGIRREVVERVRHGNYGPVQPNGPRDAQAWLRGTWAKARAALARLSVPFFGFRVAEPHHDGCPHWHMLLWTAPEHLDRLREVLRAQWLADHPHEAGADEHRFKAVAMERGGAAGYIAKYIAKNIDDDGCVIEGQKDDEATPDMFGGSAADRVETWAAAHGIRQFQAIGQPPVTVWRELRRIEEERAAGGSEAVKKAHQAATRGLLRRADWRAYMDAQGGAMVGRRYAVRLLTEDRDAPGRYGPATTPLVLGVVDAAAPDAWILSNRREWKPRGSWDKGAAERRAEAARPLLGVSFAPPRASAPQARPWTRVNNCTGGPAELMRSGLVGLQFQPEPGGSPPSGAPPWAPAAPPEPPPRPLPRLPRLFSATPSESARPSMPSSIA